MRIERRLLPLTVATLMAPAACKKDGPTVAPAPTEAAADDDGEVGDDSQAGVAGIHEAAPPSVLTTESFESVVNGHMQEVVDCYTEAQGKHAKLAGRLVARFTIAGDGSVAEIEAAAGSTLTDKGLLSCIEGRTRTWRFDPTPSGEPMPMEFPFDLAPG